MEVDIVYCAPVRGNNMIDGGTREDDTSTQAKINNPSWKHLKIPQKKLLN